MCTIFMNYNMRHATMHIMKHGKWGEEMNKETEQTPAKLGKHLTNLRTTKERYRLALT